MTNASPFFSVVIPAYKRPQLTQRAVESALAQTFTDFEIVVVDDASPEPVATGMRLPNDPRIRLLRREKNGGGSAARNTGIDAARGHIVALLDSDDLWLPGKLEAEAAWVRTFTGPARWLLFSRFWVDSVNGRTMSREADWHPRRELAEFLFAERGPMQTSSLVLPTALAREVRFDERLPRLQDWDFVLRVAAAAAHIEHLPVATAIYDAPDDAERISSRLDPDFLLGWIRERASWMGPRAYSGFLANKVAPELVQTGRRLEAVPLLAQGLRHKVMTPRYFAIELVRLAVPQEAFGALLKARRKLRERAHAG